MIRGNDRNISRRRLILALADPVWATVVSHVLRQRGWEVCPALTGCEVRRLACIQPPAAVVLDADLPDESGWLTCNKLTWGQPEVRVILVAPTAPPESQRFAAFVGATALVSRQDGLSALLAEVQGAPLPAAC